MRFAFCLVLVTIVLGARVIYAQAEFCSVLPTTEIPLPVRQYMPRVEVEAIRLQRRLILLYVEGNYELGITLVDEFVATSGETRDLYFFRGCMNLALGNTDMAQADFERFTTLEGDAALIVNEDALS